MSRNHCESTRLYAGKVAPREGRVSRNSTFFIILYLLFVAPREGRVSRNDVEGKEARILDDGRAPRGACE